MNTSFAVPAAILFLLSAAAAMSAENLMENGGFEQPAVKIRTLHDSASSPVNGGVQSLWQTVDVNSTPEGGGLTAGLTNEIAHSGAQSFFVLFDHITRGYQSVVLKTALIPVLPDNSYRLGLWGRVDKKNPVTLGERLTYLKIQVEFLKDDGTSSEGEPEYRIQSLPGSKNRDPIFTADKWNEFSMDVPTPADAAFLVLTLKVETGTTPGTINGLIFFDDVSISGDPSPLKTPKPKAEETPEPESTPETTGTSDSGPETSGTTE